MYVISNIKLIMFFKFINYGYLTYRQMNQYFVSIDKKRIITSNTITKIAIKPTKIDIYNFVDTLCSMRQNALYILCTHYQNIQCENNCKFESLKNYQNNF